MPESNFKNADEAIVAPSTRSGALPRALAEARRHPRLAEDEERGLAVLARKGDSSAAQTLVLHNLWLVVSMAFRYRRAWTELADLIQEGTVGLIEAVRRWEASLGARFSTYASYWIRAHILRFILTNARLVSIGNTRAGRKLFFRLEKERQKLLAEGFDPTPKLLAARLDVSEKDVAELGSRVDTPEVSLDAPAGGSAIVDGLARPGPSPEELASEHEAGRAISRVIEGFERALDERERVVWREFLVSDEPVSLAKLGERFGVSKQRMGQIADRLKKRLRAELVAKVGPDLAPQHA